MILCVREISAESQVGVVILVDITLQVKVKRTVDVGPLRFPLIDIDTDEIAKVPDRLTVTAQKTGEAVAIHIRPCGEELRRPIDMALMEDANPPSREEAQRVFNDRHAVVEDGGGIDDSC